MKWKLTFAFLFLTSIVALVYYSRMPLIEYTVVTTEVVQRLDEDGYPTGEGHMKQPSTKTYKDNNAAKGGALGFGIIAGASLLCFAWMLRREDKL